MISIIIPALNEENYLPKLLDSINRQAYKDYEIIVADANSKDSTVKIARKYGCKVVKGGGLPGISRNRGVKTAKGDILLFLDADSVIGKDFLADAVKEMENRNLDAAGTFLKPLSNKIIDRIFLGIFNFWTYATQAFYPNACGSGIFCKRWLHEKIKGFDEEIKLSEDMDYVKRAGKLGKFGIIRNPKVIYSMRRYDREGRLKVGFKLFLSVLYRLIFGEIRSNVFNYKLKYKR